MEQGSSHAQSQARASERAALLKAKEKVKYAILINNPFSFDLTLIVCTT